MKGHLLPLVLLVYLLVFSCPGVEANAQILRPRVVTLSGEVAPSGDGLNLSLFRFEHVSAVMINDRGDVLYSASLDEIRNDRNISGLWFDPAAAGEPSRSLGIIDTRSAPGLPTTTRYQGVSNAVLDHAGNVLATVDVIDDDPGSLLLQGTWLATPNGVDPVLIPGQTMPGFDPAETVLQGGPGYFSGSGNMLLQAFTDQGRSGWWRSTGGSPELIDITGTPAADFPGFSIYRIDGRINNSGEVALLTTARNGLVDQDAIYRVAADGTRQLLVAEGSIGGTPPGTPPGSEYAGLNDIRINDAGTISFATQYRTPSGEIGEGIWMIPPGETATHPVVVTGMPTPDGTGVFTNIFAQFLNYHLNENDRIGFNAFVDVNGVETTLGWIGGFDGLAQVTMENDPVPALGDGVVVPFGASPTVNDTGTEFYSVGLAGTGVTPANNEAILFRKPGGVLTPVVREGQLLEVAPGDLRVVEGWGPPIIAEPGRPTQINAHDELVLGIVFEDGTSGVFVFTVPEPIGLVFYGLAALAMSWHRTRYLSG